MNSALEKRPLVCLITPGNVTTENFKSESLNTLALIEKAVEQKIPLIQIREKRLTAHLLLELAKEAVAITAATGSRILINDRLDLALAVSAAGVHLTAGSIPANVVRKNSPADFIIGVSCHTSAAAEKAKRDKADFAFYSPIFNTPNKLPPKGVENLSIICSQLKPFPILALGGISKTNYTRVLAAGAAGFASISFLTDERNMKKVSRELL